MDRVYPKISVVTPSFNQAQFLERTIRSILDQNYPNLEYVIIDGGSTDGSLKIIKKYAKKLHYWMSKKDSGQYDALNKGFAHTTGEVMGYLNSDDIHLPWTLETVAMAFQNYSDIEWISSTFPMGIDSKDRAVSMHQIYGFTKSGFFKGENLMLVGWPGTGYIQQESTFWRRRLWNRAGAKFDTTLKYAGEFDLWMRFFQLATLTGVNIPMAGFRFHEAQKTSIDLYAYLDEAKKVFFSRGGKKPNLIAQLIRIFAHRCLLPAPRDFLIKTGLLTPADVLTTDIVTHQWCRVKK